MNTRPDKVETYVNLFQLHMKWADGNWQEIRLIAEAAKANPTTRLKIKVANTDCENMTSEVGRP